MELQTLTRFFMWCTILNGSILALWSITFLLAPDFIYRLQTKWFPLPRETYNVVIYSFLGLFKIFFLIFNIVPYAALLIVG
jgi:hypothetical protein